jgi:hypothetical protein
VAARSAGLTVAQRSHPEAGRARARRRAEVRAEGLARIRLARQERAAGCGLRQRRVGHNIARCSGFHIGRSPKNQPPNKESHPIQQFDLTFHHAVDAALPISCAAFPASVTRTQPQQNSSDLRHSLPSKEDQDENNDRHQPQTARRVMATLEDTPLRIKMMMMRSTIPRVIVSVPLATEYSPIYSKSLASDVHDRQSVMGGTDLATTR